MPRPIESLRDLIDRHCKAPKQATAVPRLTLFRSEAPTAPVRSMYDPRLCIVVQGRKRVMLGDRIFDIGASDYLVATIDLPVSASVTEAGEDAPHLALTLDLDRSGIADLLIGMSSQPQPAHASAGLAVALQTDELIDPVCRLANLLDQTSDIEVLAPLIEREILYRLLRDGVGDLLRQYATAGTHLSQIGQAAAWIKMHYAEPMSVDRLAGLAGMSVTSFHRHFRAVTTMSPLQYRARVRLQEAQRRLLVEGQDAGKIGFDVGYDSQSQFSREYRRMFGMPPAADAARLRRTRISEAS